MEQRRQMRRGEYSRDQVWKRGGRGAKSTAGTRDRKGKQSRWGGSRLGMEEGKGVQQKQGMKERREYSRDEGWKKGERG